MLKRYIDKYRRYQAENDYDHHNYNTYRCGRIMHGCVIVSRIILHSDILISHIIDNMNIGNN